MRIEDLSPELQARARSVRTPEEIISLASEIGFDLSDEDLADIVCARMWDSECPFDQCVRWVSE